MILSKNPSINNFPSTQSNPC